MIRFFFRERNTCWNPTWPSTSTSSWLLTSTKLTGEPKLLPPSARISSINWWSPAALREHIGSPCWYGTDVSVKHCFVRLPNKTFPSINLLLVGSCQRKPRRVLRCLKFLNCFQHKLVWQLTPCETWRLEDRDRLFFLPGSFVRRTVSSRLFLFWHSTHSCSFMVAWWCVVSGPLKCSQTSLQKTPPRDPHWDMGNFSARFRSLHHLLGSEFDDAPSLRACCCRWGLSHGTEWWQVEVRVFCWIDVHWFEKIWQ